MKVHDIIVVRRGPLAGHTLVVVVPPKRGGTTFVAHPRPTAWYSSTEPARGFRLRIRDIIPKSKIRITADEIRRNVGAALSAV